MQSSIYLHSPGISVQCAHNSSTKTSERTKHSHLKVRSVEGKTHQAATNETSNWDSHDPREEQKSHSLPVDGLEGSIAETDTDSRTSDTHGCRDWELVLREDEDGDGGAHLHGGTTGWGVVGDFVAHD